MNSHPQNRWASLAVLALVSVVIGLDTTILNVALPSLAGGLSATTSELQWFAASYLLVLAVLLLPAGLLGDLVGRKPMTVISLVIFGVGSVWSSYAGSPNSLIAARSLMGAGAALVTPLTYSWLLALFPDDERPKAMGVLGGAGFVGMPLGPIVGGWLLDRYFWGSVFLINVPLIVVAAVAGIVLLPSGGRIPGRQVDAPGIMLSALGLAALTYGMIEAPVRGWTNSLVLLTAIGGIGMLVCFGWWEMRRRQAQALMDMTLWRLPAFSWGVVVMTAASLLGIVAMFTMPIYFQAVLDVNALGSGIRLLPMLAGVVIGIVAGVRLSGSVGYKTATLAGLALVIVGGLLAQRTEVMTGYAWVGGWLTVFGAGFGTLMIVGQNLALNTLDESRAAVGGAIAQVMRQTGSVVGIAILGSALNSTYRDRVDVTGLTGPLAETVRDSVQGGLAVAQQVSPQLVYSVKAALVSGIHAQMWLSIGLAVLCTLAALSMMPKHLCRAQAAPLSMESSGGPYSR